MQVFLAASGETRGKVPDVTRAVISSKYNLFFPADYFRLLMWKSDDTKIVLEILACGCIENILL